MKRLLTLFLMCLIAVTAYCQYSAHHRKFQKRYIAPAAFPQGWLFYLRDAPTYYVPGVDGVEAAWTDPDSGFAATQSTHLNKPVISGLGLQFNATAGKGNLTLPPSCVPYPSVGFMTSSGTAAAAIKLTNYNTTGTYFGYISGISPMLCFEQGSKSFRVYDGGFVWDGPGGVGNNTFHVMVHRDKGLNSNVSGEVFYNGTKSATKYAARFGVPIMVGSGGNPDGYEWSGIIFAAAHWNRYLSDGEVAALTAAWTARYNP